jgi:hypothetical protein
MSRTWCCSNFRHWVPVLNTDHVHYQVDLFSIFNLHGSLLSHKHLSSHQLVLAPSHVCIYIASDRLKWVCSESFSITSHSHLVKFFLWLPSALLMCNSVPYRWCNNFSLAHYCQWCWFHQTMKLGNESDLHYIWHLMLWLPALFPINFCKIFPASFLGPVLCLIQEGIHT